MWYFYVLVCCDKSFYGGVTTDLKRRLNEHNNTKKGAKYTRSRRPVRLLYDEKHPTRSSALKAEYAFKKMSRKKKIRYLNERLL